MSCLGMVQKKKRGTLKKKTPIRGPCEKPQELPLGVEAPRAHSRVFFSHPFLVTCSGLLDRSDHFLLGNRFGTNFYGLKSP